MASCSHLVPWLMMVQSVRKGVGPLGVKIRTQYHGVPHPTDPPSPGLTLGPLLKFDKTVTTALFWSSDIFKWVYIA